jgi:hypothetical protein
VARYYDNTLCTGNEYIVPLVVVDNIRRRKSGSVENQFSPGNSAVNIAISERNNRPSMSINASKEF